MRKFSLLEFIKLSVAYTVTTSTGLSAIGYALDQSPKITIYNDYYYLTPVIGWGIISIPLSISLASKLINQITPHKTRITTRETGSNYTGRKIPITVNNRKGAIFMSVFDSYLRNNTKPKKTNKSREWLIEYRGNQIIIDEDYVYKFIKIAFNRPKNQLSRNYWLKQKRLPMTKDQYYAVVELLNNHSLIDNRRQGYSGQLNSTPMTCLLILRNTN